MEQKKYGLNELREMFLSYFESKGHLRLPSFSLVPQNDASLLLINSGMAPMKPYFKGEQEPPRRRICTCQKCIRTGDIENIGKTARHGTYFEMLGNFSFGDYFKEESLAYSWEFLTKVVGLSEDRLYPSIYENDDEAFEIWNKQIGIAPERIFRFGKADNFWEHGAGPCGPCSEIYYDRGEKYGCGSPDCTVGCECDRFIEVWNNVFSQFDNDGNGNYTELVQKNIDTGMGLERLAVVCQDVDSLFDVDTVMNITNRVSQLTGAYYGKTQKMDVSLRVITDHIRSSVFMICDGVLPSNEGRGYVLRRLLRRAARHGKLLGVNEPFLYQVVETVVQENEGQYPDVREKQAYITKVIKVEEENFAKTIDGGMKIYGEMLAAYKAEGTTVFSGADAFKLYDTYGFPIDLTLEMVEEEGMTVDQDAFTALMQEQRQRARKAREALGDLGWSGVDLGQEMPETVFVGYTENEAEGKILAIVAEDEQRQDMVAGVEAIVVMDKTPFYAEMGGQVGDHGVIVTADGEFEVRDVQKNKGGKYLHYGVMRAGTMKVGETVTAKIDTIRRAAIARAHTATHLLQAALEKTLGEHCHQAGSLVEPDHLRFDFTHFSAVTQEELSTIVRDVMEAVLDGDDVDTMVLPIEEAKKLGATALFGEKYGDTVRVVKMGERSLEFCGGTHLNNTAKVGMFRVVSEASVASGVRRIEAYTGKEVLRQLDEMKQTIQEAAEILKTTPKELLNKAAATMQEIKDAKQNVDRLKDKLFSGDIERTLFAAKSIAGLRVVTVTRSDIETGDLRKMGDFLKDKAADVVALLAAVQDDKITLNAVCGKDAIAKGIKAGDIIKNLAPICGGRGGGKPDSAMGGGTDVLKLDDMMAALDDYVAANAK
ncbi:MAG: alanine--tRNA ligase [Oscillospiraceae bacterium]|nr:alanine--tRNA ligase [Oscillospiraceae bacterium]